MPGTSANNSVRVCHVAMGDLWAGAEVQLTTLIAELVNMPAFDVSVVLFNEGRLASEVRKLGVPVMVFPESEQSGLTLLRTVTAYCRTHKFDLLHTHKYKDNLVGVCAAVRCRIPHVVRTVHGLSEPFDGIEAIKMRIYDDFDDLAIRLKVDRLIAVSSQIEQVLSRRYGAHRVVQIHNGIRLSGITATKSSHEVREHLGVPATRRLIGTVGRLTQVKGHEHFLSAAQLLLKEHEDLHFVVVGDGPLMERLKITSDDIGIAGRISFLGHRDDTYDLIRAMEIFVLPSLHEGIPMVILEALALGRPVVASRVGGIPEVISDGVQGLLVPPGDPYKLAEACGRLLTDCGLAERCSRAGQIRVEQDFSSTSMGEAVAALYHELIRSARSQ